MSNRIVVAAGGTPLKDRGCVSGIDVNGAEAAEWIARLATQGADLVCFPEGFLYAGLADRKPHDLAAAPENDLARTFAGLARDCGIYLAVPMLERAPTAEVCNAVLLFGRDGSRIGAHRKRILWPSDSQLSELEDGVTPGAEPVPFATEFGPIGIQTCLELHWPSGWHALGRAGARLILFPSEQAGGAIVRHRAWDARSFVVSAVAKGGPSQVIDPLGNVIAEWPPGTESPIAELPFDFELVHLDYTERELRRLARFNRGSLAFRFLEPERLCVVTGHDSQIR